MKKPSFEKFNYSLRPAKNIERKMFCEVFARLSRIAPLRQYRYIGFGANTFVDFTLFHQRLGISDMISIEGFDENKKQIEFNKKRIEFNKPYSCIKMMWGKSFEVLPKLQWNKRTILWLDYDFQINKDVLADVRLAIAKMKSGSIIAATFDVDFDDDNVDETTNDKRMNALIDAVGEQKIPFRTRPVDLAGWGYAKICRNVFNNEIESALQARNGPNHAWQHLKYEQLFNIHYADRAKMLTVGGILLSQEDHRKLSIKDFEDLEFVNNDESPYRIYAPVLTTREVRHLNSKLPSPNSNEPSWLPEDDRKKYGKVYRYYPAYTEVEM
jgi:hypothetical protein